MSEKLYGWINLFSDKAGPPPWVWKLPSGKAFAVHAVSTHSSSLPGWLCLGEVTEFICHEGLNEGQNAQLREHFRDVGASTFPKDLGRLTVTSLAPEPVTETKDPRWKPKPGEKYRVIFEGLYDTPYHFHLKIPVIDLPVGINA